jgi:hypothetical protein
LVEISVGVVWVFVTDAGDPIEESGGVDIMVLEVDVATAGD